MDKILGIIVYVLARVFIFAFLVWTGEILVFIASAGWRKPSWDLHTKRNDYFEFEIFASISFWIGLIFWGLLITFSMKYLL